MGGCKCLLRREVLQCFFFEMWQDNYSHGQPERPRQYSHAKHAPSSPPHALPPPVAGRRLALSHLRVHLREHIPLIPLRQLPCRYSHVAPCHPIHHHSLAGFNLGH